MGDKSKRNLIRKYAENFIFREQSSFGLNFSAILRPANKLGLYKPYGKFISIQFNKNDSSKRSTRSYIFRRTYKMMRQFNYSLN